MGASTMHHLGIKKLSYGNFEKIWVHKRNKQQTLVTVLIRTPLKNKNKYLLMLFLKVQNLYSYYKASGFTSL